MEEGVGVWEWSDASAASYDVSRAELGDRMEGARVDMWAGYAERERRRLQGVGALAPRPVVLAADAGAIAGAAQAAGWLDGVGGLRLGAAAEAAYDVAVGDENTRMACWYAQWVKKKRMWPEQDGIWGKALPQPWSMRDDDGSNGAAAAGEEAPT